MAISAKERKLSRLGSCKGGCGGGRKCLVHCPAEPSGVDVSLSLSLSPPVAPLQWDRLVYTALIDGKDNSTIVFAKGMNLRPGRLGVASRYQCVFGRDLSKAKHVLTSPVISAAQEIFRCVTPVRIRRYLRMSIDAKGNGDSDEKPMFGIGGKRHTQCVYDHAAEPSKVPPGNGLFTTRILVWKRWFIYDNNSDDDIQQVLNTMDPSRYNVTHHLWPWMKSQEAGFAHCALRARESYWQDEENVGSRDRAPGLGTKPVEPEDWPRRFCEVYDTGLKDFVHEVFTDPDTGNLPW
ncbi:hypothetical protein HU200_004258 [Digitaria exilis]|uniref:Glycosyltransferase family 92 protein n=1 Tax=Digitaria exilis TaxID=1010633 RepID=A0A835FTN7_9POAL|nr:hypothetical protein HU200_004258 [Digitaria exilis]